MAEKKKKKSALEEAQEAAKKKEDPTDKQLGTGNPSSASETIMAQIDGRVFMAQERHIQAYDRDNTYLGQVTEHTGQINSLITYENMLISASDDHTVRTWSKEGEEIEIYAGHSDAVTCVEVAASPSDGLLASGSRDNTIIIWNTKVVGKHCQMHQMTGHTHWVTTLKNVYHHLCSASADASVRVWNARAGNCTRVFTGHIGWIRCMTQYGDHKNPQVVSGGSKDCVIKIWNCKGKDRACQATLEGHTDWITCLACSNHLLCSGSKDGTIRVWDTQVAKGHPCVCLSVFFGHNEVVRCLRPIDRFLVSGSADKKVMIWDVRRGVNVAVMEGHFTTVSAVSDKMLRLPGVAPMTYIISCGDNGVARMWGISEGHPEEYLKCTATLQSVDSPNYWMNHLDGQDALVAVASADYSISMWAVNKGELIQSFTGHIGMVTALVYVKAQKWLVSVSEDCTLRVWNVFSGKSTCCAEGHRGPIRCLVHLDVSQDKTLLCTGSDDTSIRIWEVDEHSANCVRTLGLHKEPVTTLAGPCMDRYLVSGSRDCYIRFWNFRKDWKCDKIFQDGNMAVNNLWLDKTATDQFLCATGKNIKLWDISEKAVVKQMVGHTDAVYCVTGGCNSKWDIKEPEVYTGGLDKLFRVWDGKRLTVVKEYTMPAVVRSIACLPCPLEEAIDYPFTNNVLVGLQSGEVHVFKVATNKWPKEGAVDIWKHHEHPITAIIYLDELVEQVVEDNKRKQMEEELKRAKAEGKKQEGTKVFKF